MGDTDWTYWTAGRAAAALAAREVSALELTQAAIARIERHDAGLNAICVRDFDRALSAARAADAALRGGARGPLLGVPMTVKESFNVAGLPTTWGLPEHRDAIAEEDALAVERVKAAGAVVLGKTNVPRLLLDFQSYNEIYGTTNHPQDPRLTAGGSSGGSSAALAAGFGALSLGSDIAGSLRAPAHFCGVYAHKPTLGLVPTRGHNSPGRPPLPVRQDLGVVGPMARCASDLALLLETVAGPDRYDLELGYRLALPPVRQARLQDYRVLVLDQHPLTPTAVDIRRALSALADRLEGLGVAVTRGAPPPDLAGAARVYMRLLMSSTKATPDEHAAAMAAAARLAPEDDSLDAERTRGAALSHLDWIKADAERVQFRVRWRAVFEAFDLVICPASPTPAYPHDHSPDVRGRKLMVDGQPIPYFDQFVWCSIASLLGLPSTAFPIGESAAGLPIGAQAIAPWHHDFAAIRFAELLEAEFGGFRPPRTS